MAQWLENRIDRKNREKAVKRRKYSLSLMKAYKGQYPCSTCLHGLSENCDDPLPNGCEYHYNPKTETFFPNETLDKPRYGRKLRKKAYNQAKAC